MTAPRTRTPSEVKWLVNELAALDGEMEKIDLELSRLHTRRVKLAATHAELAKVAALMGVAKLPDLVPPVRTHRPYGGRGKLREFLREALRTNYPTALDSLTLASMAVRHFWETFESDQQRDHFRDEIVTHTLRKLVYRDEVERVHATTSNRVGGWRWKGNAPAPSMSELLALAADSVGG